MFWKINIIIWFVHKSGDWFLTNNSHYNLHLNAQIFLAHPIMTNDEVTINSNLLQQINN